MRVVAEEPWDWFLYDDAGTYFLGVLIEHGAISFDVNAQLNAEQAAEYARVGKGAIMRFSAEIRSKVFMREWRPPPLPSDWEPRSLAAVYEWQKGKSEL